MLATVRLFARYNALVNAAMNQVLATVGPGEWTKDRGGFFPSLQKLAAHIYSTDVAWLVRFTGLHPFNSVKGGPFDFPPAAGDLPFESFEDYLPKRKFLDEAFVAFAAEVTEADLSSELSYRNARGEAFTKPFGPLLLHLFNHQTHHRGMVALYLDQAGVKNDFSSLSSYLS